MDGLPVHIALLSIADDAASAARASAQAVSEKAGAAGHQIVDEELVKDNEAAIRDQLVRWISHDNIDVVIVLASVENESASAALAPLIMQTLPGFTDLFRWLTFQEIGASAMQSAAEAAQCQGTFVFVLPAHDGAVRAAMDKLILPQLDVRTKPKNLVTQMPRLRDAAKRFVPDRSQPVVSAPIPSVVAPRPDTEPEAVPEHVAPAKEITQGGPGLPPKLPAPTAGTLAQPRGKPRTANTIARKTDDPPTKPIDLAKLEKQIQLSTQYDAQTKQIDLKANDALTKVVDMSAHQAKTRVVDAQRVLPRVPPGADESSADDDLEALTFTAPPRPNPATQALPSTVRSPAPVGISKPPSSTSVSPFATPIARSTPPQGRQAVATPPPSPVVRQEARTPPPTPVVRQPAGQEPKTTVASRYEAKSAAARQPAVPQDGKTPPIALTRDMAITPVKGTSVVAPRGASPPIALTQDMAITPVKGTPVVSAPVRETKVSLVPPPPVVVNPRMGTAGSQRGQRPPTAPTHDDEARTGRGSNRPQITNPEAQVAANDEAPTTARATVDDEAPTTRAASDSSRSAPNAAELWARAIAPITEPAKAPEHAPEAAPVSPVSNLFAPQPRKRQLTPPPPAHLDPFAAAAQQPVGIGDLPEGDFVYPIKRSGTALLIKIVVALALLAAGFFAFITFYPSDKPVETAAVAPQPEPAPVAKPPEPTPPPAPPEPQKPEEIEIDTPPVNPTAEPTHGASTTKPSDGASTKPTTKPSTKPTTKPTTKPSSDGTTSKPEHETTEPKPKPEQEVTAKPGCDEVGCVLSKYDRPCCERFKPSDSFTPKNVVPDELDRSMVKAGVEKIKPRVVACGEQNGAKGTVRLAVTVDGEGTVKTVSVSEAPDSALGECVAAAMRKAKFGKSVNGGEFNYPFVF